MARTASDQPLPPAPSPNCARNSSMRSAGRAAAPPRVRARELFGGLPARRPAKGSSGRSRGTASTREPPPAHRRESDARDAAVVARGRRPTAAVGSRARTLDRPAHSPRNADRPAVARGGHAGAHCQAQRLALSVATSSWHYTGAYLLAPQLPATFVGYGWSVLPLPVAASAGAPRCRTPAIVLFTPCLAEAPPHAYRHRRADRRTPPSATSQRALDPAAVPGPSLSSRVTTRSTRS